MRSEDLRGVRIEGKDYGDEVALACDGCDAAEDFAVAGVDAVEIADGDD
jgi:hypothetical protein